MRKQKRYETEQEIIDAIDLIRTRQSEALMESEQAETECNHHRKQMEDESKSHMVRLGHQSQARQLHERMRALQRKAFLYDEKARRMSEVLAAFRTDILPGVVEDRGVVAR